MDAYRFPNYSHEKISLRRCGRLIECDTFDSAPETPVRHVLPLYEIPVFPVARSDPYTRALPRSLDLPADLRGTGGIYGNDVKSRSQMRRSTRGGRFYHRSKELGGKGARTLPSLQREIMGKEKGVNATASLFFAILQSPSLRTVPCCSQTRFYLTFDSFYT